VTIGGGEERIAGPLKRRRDDLRLGLLGGCGWEVIGYKER
jgi:hypothetical protein